MKNIRFVFALTASLALCFAVGCAHKKVAKAAPVPATPPASPTATLSAYPTAVQAGQTATLSWQTENANAVTIDGIGTVSASGSRQVTPQSSTNYVLTAKGPGGERDASARVTVMPAATSASANPSLIDQFNSLVKDVYFDYDKYNIRTDQQAAAERAAQFLAAHPELKVTIEGHCDDRGSEEYNLALGDSRASSLRSELLKSGAQTNQLKTISYGKEHPFCTQENEQCWQQNRRDHYVANGQ